MVPNASELARRRHMVVVIMRLTALVPLLAAGFALAIGLSDQAYSAIRGRADLLEILPSIIIAFFFTALAAAFVWLLPRAADVFVPRVRELRCPFCGYRLAGITEPRCPECGQPLTPEFLGDPPAHAGLQHEPEAVRLERHRTIMMPVVRLIALLGLMLSMLVALPYVANVVISLPTSNDADLARRVVFFMTAIMPGFAISLFALVKTNLVARWLVPARKQPDPAAKTPPPTSQ